jgi:hypothetical protein
LYIFFTMAIEDSEKTMADQREEKALSPVSSGGDDDPILKEFTPEETRKIIHRIDRRLVTTVGLMYCISLMDRTNLSVAAIAGFVYPILIFIVPVSSLLIDS